MSGALVIVFELKPSPVPQPTAFATRFQAVGSNVLLTAPIGELPETLSIATG